MVPVAGSVTDLLRQSLKEQNGSLQGVPNQGQHVAIGSDIVNMILFLW